MPELQARARLHDTILCRNRLRRLAGCVATMGGSEARPDRPMTDSHARGIRTAAGAGGREPGCGPPGLCAHSASPDHGAKLDRPFVSAATKRVPWANTGWLNTLPPPTGRVLRMAPVAALIR